MESRRRTRKLRWLLPSIALLSACATTEQAPTIKYSGFLKTYGEFERGGEGQALMVYQNPRADFARYDKIILDPVTIWRQRGSTLLELSTEEQEELSNRLHAAVARELSKDYQLVETRGRDVMRVRIALTEASGASAVGNVISTVTPVRLFDSAKKLATGTHAFVGKAGIEGEIVDSRTGERLLAAIDERAGGKAIRGSTSTWGAVDDSFDYWANQMRERLVALRFEAAGS